jgi:hypothetical protein
MVSDREQIKSKGVQVNIHSETDLGIPKVPKVWTAKTREGFGEEMKKLAKINYLGTKLIIRGGRMSINEAYIFGNILGGSNTPKFQLLSLKNKIKIFQACILGKFRFLLQAKAFDMQLTNFLSTIRLKLCGFLGIFSISYAEMISWKISPVQFIRTCYNGKNY